MFSLPKMPVATVHQLVGHHCEKEGEQGEEEPGGRVTGDLGSTWQH